MDSSLWAERVNRRSWPAEWKLFFPLCSSCYIIIDPFEQQAAGQAQRAAKRRLFESPRP